MWIDELQENEIFVFGSNAMGHHRGGAARTAHSKFGAIWGQGHGLQGRSYAIDSMSGIEILSEEVASFYAFAADRPDLQFLVTPIGTGIAGLSVDVVAPLFAFPPDNVHLPDEFVDVLDPPFVRELPPLHEIDTVAPSYVDDEGNEIVPGLMLGGPLDGSLMGMPIFPGAPAPQGAGHPVQVEGLQDVVAWYVLRTATPIAERYVYEFDGFRDRRGRKLELPIPQGADEPSAPSAPVSEAAADERFDVADLHHQIQELAAMPPIARNEYRNSISPLSPRLRPELPGERLWNIDDPVRTEARVLRALADAVDDRADMIAPRSFDDEYILSQYLSRARYAQGHWELAGHPIDMGDPWWAMQLLQLIRARQALAAGEAADAIHALTFAVSGSLNAGADLDYTLEGLVELAFLGDVGPDRPSPTEWADVALALVTGLPGWTPGRWFTHDVRARLEQIVEAADETRK